MMVLERNPSHSQTPGLMTPAPPSAIPALGFASSKSHSYLAPRLLAYTLELASLTFSD